MTPQRLQEIKRDLNGLNYERLESVQNQCNELISEVEQLNAAARLMYLIAERKKSGIELLAALGSIGDTLETNECVDLLQDYFNWL